MNRLADVAYLAGVIDSDGCIRVEKANNNGRSRDSVSYHVILTIAQVEMQAVRLAEEVFGGYLLFPKPKNERSRPMVRWTAKSQKAAAALQELRPFLRIKGAQADNALALAALVAQSRSDRCKGRVRSGARARDEAETAAMHACYLESRRLNSGELNPEYIVLQAERTRQPGLALECAAAAIGESGHE